MSVKTVKFLNILEQTCILTKSTCQKEDTDVVTNTRHNQCVAGSTDTSMLLCFKSLTDLCYQPPLFGHGLLFFSAFFKSANSTFCSMLPCNCLVSMVEGFRGAMWGRADIA